MPLESVDYDERLHQVYQAGRAMSVAAKEAWMQAFAPFVSADPHCTRPRILDLGSGTGRFSPTLADAFDANITGIEPSARMRQIASRDAAHPSVAYVGGVAESIPIRSNAFDSALLYLSWHHVRAQPLAARELRRVVRDRGTVLLRTSFADRMPDLWWYDYFPNARRVDASMYPAYEAAVRLFTEAGFTVIQLVSVNAFVAATPAENLAQLRLRAISTFEHLDESEIARGFKALDAAVGGMAADPIRLDLDLLVLS